MELTLKYSIPEVAIEPDLRETEVSIKTIAFNCIETARSKILDSNRIESLTLFFQKLNGNIQKITNHFMIPFAKIPILFIY